ncbi:hypothetical protein M3Y97_00047400 [Aphelenchoides bicaudatus]|nr:hypothetical protein M3Y97_00047400 [Aphelenchoides bicaudatus]
MLLYLLLALLAISNVEAKPKCVNTIYIIPMLVETSIDSDFDQFRSYLANCSSKLQAGNEKTNIVLLSLEKQAVDSCSVWSDCKKILTGDTVNNEALTIKSHKTYEIGDFIMDNLKGDRYCLKNAVLQIITNIRCQQIANYPMLNLILNEDISTFSNFINYRNLGTTVFWYNFDYISPSDNIGCDDLYGLKKEVNSMLTVVYRKESNSFMNKLSEQCGE